MSSIVVVVEDDLGLAAMIETVLESAPDVTPETVSDEATALSLIKRDHPVLVILDMTLPYATRLLRAVKHDVSARHIPVVALRSWRHRRGSNAPQVPQGPRDDFDPPDAVLHTPFDVEDLLDIVARYIPREREYGAA